MVNNFGISLSASYLSGSIIKLKEGLELAKKFNFSNVELSVHGLDIVINGKIYKERLKSIKKILRNFDFNYSIHLPESLNLMNVNDIKTELSIFESCIEIAEVIKAKNMVYHPGRFIDERYFFKKSKIISNKQKEKLKKYELNNLNKFIEGLNQKNIYLLFENLCPYLDIKGYTYAEDIKEIIEQIKKINSTKIKINLDIGHAYLFSKFYRKNFIDVIRPAVNYIIQVHIHDNFGKVSYYNEREQNFLIPNGRGDLHLPPGFGDIPFKKLFNELKLKDIILTFEIKNRFLNNENIIYMIDYIKDMIKTLK